MEFLQSLCVGAVGGIVSFAGGWALLARSEWYKTQARFDPLAQELWRRRTDLYPEIAALAFRIDVELQTFAQSRDPAAAAERLGTLATELERATDAAIMLFEREDVFLELMRLALAAELHATHDDNAPTDWPSSLDITNTLRAELEVDRLDSQVRDAIAKLVKCEQR